MDYELNHLHHFYEVARRGGFTQAARVLRVQQPAVSRSVKLLEEMLGVTLLERHPRKVVLTAAGRQIQAICHRLFTEADNVTRAAELERGDPSGPLRIAAAGAVASRMVPNALPRLLKRFPNIWPMVFAGPSQMAFDRILDGDLELGIYFYTSSPPEGLTVRPLFNVRFHLVVRSDRARDQATLRSFIGSREVEDRAATHFPTLARLKRKFPGAAIRISTNDVEAHLRLVEAGLGVSIMPDILVASGLARGTLTDVFPREQTRFPLLLVSRRGQLLSRAATALLETLAPEQK